MAKGRKKSTTLSTSTSPEKENSVLPKDWEQELDKLQLLCNTFESLPEEAKRRNMEFFVSKYKQYVPIT